VRGGAKHLMRYSQQVFAQIAPQPFEREFVGRQYGDRVSLNAKCVIVSKPQLHPIRADSLRDCPTQHRNDIHFALDHFLSPSARTATSEDHSGATSKARRLSPADGECNAK
jgi:hypothetical protein